MEKYIGWLVGVFAVLIALWIADVIRRKTVNVNPTHFKVYRSVFNRLYSLLLIFTVGGVFLKVALSGQALAWLGVAVGVYLLVRDIFFRGFTLTVSGSEVIYRNIFIKRSFMLGDIMNISKRIRRQHNNGAWWFEYRLHIKGMKILKITNRFVNYATLIETAGFEV